MIITIDGPVASGKSTIARVIAQELGFFYINSGLLFRACAHILMRDGHLSVGQLARVSPDQLALIDFEQLHYVFDDGKEQVIYVGANITYELRSDVVALAASIIATNTVLRAIILSYERLLATHNKQVIVDGRDSGSTVFPNAELKIYLTAKPMIRAKRWQLDQEKRGVKLSVTQALDEVNARDARDKNRSIAPLVQPEGAQVIDSSEFSIKEVVQEIKNLIIH